MMLAALLLSLQFVELMIVFTTDPLIVVNAVELNNYLLLTALKMNFVELMILVVKPLYLKQVVVMQVPIFVWIIQTFHQEM